MPWHSLLLVVVLALAGPPSRAQSIAYLETPDLRLAYFHPSETYLSRYAAQCFSNALALQQKVFGFEPDERAMVLLTDFSDYGNAGVASVPRTTLLLDIAPMNFTFETFATGERMYTLMNHELVHIAMTDQPAPADQRFRSLFGGKVAAKPDHPETILYQYLTSPRVSAPSWYHEGIATFMETWMAGGLGRGQGAYDEMVFRSMVRDETRFYDPLGLASEGTKVDFQVGVNAYLYGTRFMNYIALTYGPDKLVAWVSRGPDSERYYAHAFESVFGRTLDAAWQDWIAWERDFQKANLEAVRTHPVTPYRDLSKRALGSVSRAYVDEAAGVIYAGIRYPGVLAHVGALSLEDGAIRKLHDVKGPMLYRVTSLAYDASGKRLFYTEDNLAYRDLMVLDVDSGKAERLQRDARVGDIVFNPVNQTLYGLRHLNGLVTLVAIPPPYSQWNQIHTFAYGEVLYDLDVSPDGALLSASYGGVDGHQSLRVMRISDLVEGRTTPMTQFDFGQATPESFVFSPDGRYLFGSSYYTGVSNIYRFEVESGAIAAVSNAEAGLFRPLPLEDGSLIAFRYTGAGFVPTMIDPVPTDDLSAITFLGTEVVRRHPVVATWQVPPPSTVPIDALINREGEYHSAREVGFESLYPIVEGYKDEVAAGVHANWSDPLSLTRLEATASLSRAANDQDDGERYHGELDFKHRNFWAQATYNDANFYDLFGPTERSRKGYMVGIGYDKPIIYDKPRELSLITQLRHYGDLERLPDFQNIVTTFDRVTSAEIELDYAYVESSIGSVDDEQGIRLNMAVTGDYVDDEFIPKIRAGMEAGVALPWHNSSIWLRNAAGAADGDRDNAYANFYFGGFGNNWVDDGVVKRYRDYDALPGFELNEIGGRTFARSMLEWNLPPVRFEGVGTPGFHMAWARPALFTSVLHTDFDSDRRSRTATSAGVQVDFMFSLLHRLNMTLSAGYARGLLDDEGKDEFMLSLKIL